MVEILDIDAEGGTILIRNGRLRLEGGDVTLVGGNITLSGNIVFSGSVSCPLEGSHKSRLVTVSDNFDITIDNDINNNINNMDDTTTD